MLSTYSTWIYYNVLHFLTLAIQLKHIKSHNGPFVLSKSPLNLQELLLRTSHLWFIQMTIKIHKTKSQNISLKSHSILLHEKKTNKSPHCLMSFAFNVFCFLKMSPCARARSSKSSWTQQHEKMRGLGERRWLQCSWCSILNFLTIINYPMDPSTFLGSVWGMIWRVKYLLRKCLDR